MTQHTLLFPATIPQEQPLRQLLLLFDKIFLYSPSEDIEENIDDQPLFKQYAPVPFGDDLPNFQQLIKDMTRSPADYYGSGLSALSSSTVADIDEATVWRLIQQMAPDETKNDKKREALYQARLLLRLVELQEQKEEEIDHGLEEINSRSSQLMATLKGEEDTFELSKITPPPRHTLTSSAMRQRITAWSQLFLADPKATQFTILATGQDEFELLSDHAGPNISDTPQKLYSLTVPDFTTSTPAQQEEFCTLRDSFRKVSCLPDMFATLKQAANAESINQTAINEQQQKWQKQIDKQFANFPMSTLDIYLFPNLSLPQLLAKICRTSLADEVKNSFPANGLMVVTR